MMRIGDKGYDSFANWGTSQRDEDWAWVDARLARFARSHGNLWAGRTGFDGLIHCVEWKDGGLRKSIRLWPDSEKHLVTIEITAGKRSESILIPMQEFRDAPQAHMENAFRIVASKGRLDSTTAQRRGEGGRRAW